MIDPALVIAWLDAEIADGQAEMAKQNSFADESFYSGEIMALKRVRVHVAALAQAPAAPPTCATCQHFREHQAFWCGKGISQLYPSGGTRVSMHPLPSFGCNLHAPRPASADSGEELPAARSGVIPSGLRLTDEEDSKALWLTRRLMPKASKP